MTEWLPLNDCGLLRAIAVTRGWKGHRVRVSTQSWLWRKKFSCRSCRDSNSQPFDHESGALTYKLSLTACLRIIDSVYVEDTHSLRLSWLFISGFKSQDWRWFHVFRSITSYEFPYQRLLMTMMITNNTYVYFKRYRFLLWSVRCTCTRSSDHEVHLLQTH